jgi:hypothetical protein
VSVGQLAWACAMCTLVSQSDTSTELWYKRPSAAGLVLLSVRLKYLTRIMHQM